MEITVASMTSVDGAMANLRIAVVDDHSMITSGLASRLAESKIAVEEHTVVEDVESPQDLDVVLLDLHLHDQRVETTSKLQGTAAVRFLVDQGTRVVIISGGAEQVDICDSIGIGALSYVPKERADILVDVLFAVSKNQRVLTGALAGALHADLVRRPLKGLQLEELGADDCNFLEIAFHLDGGITAAMQRKWQDSELEETLNRIWSAATTRTAAFDLLLTAREIELVIAWARLQSREEVMVHLGIEPATFQKHLTNIKNKYLDSYPSAANLNPNDILRLLARRAL